MDTLRISDEQDYQRLIRLLMEAVGDSFTASGLVNGMLQRSPRASDIRGRIVISGQPRAVAVNMVQALITFGSDIPGRQALTLLIDELKRYVGVDDTVFLNLLIAKYGIVSSFPAADVKDGTAFEKLVKQSNSFLDIARWRDKLAAIELQVCCVETTTSYGTGFLVGPDVVMTNYHVVKNEIKQPERAANVRLRFDFKKATGSDRPRSGEEYRLKADDWLLDASPMDEVDDLPDPKPREADVDKLDYALLHLDGKPGDERGWVSAHNTAHDFKASAALFIVQHPKGRPMKLALDTEAVVGANRNGSRVRYRTNTEPGSSGSPCFNQNWELVALHHSGEPAQLATWNEGIPIATIVALLEQRGRMAALGPG